MIFFLRMNREEATFSNKNIDENNFVLKGYNKVFLLCLPNTPESDSRHNRQVAVTRYKVETWYKELRDL